MECISVIVYRSKMQIEQDLANLAPTTLVVGSQMLEDGYELILEGPVDEVEQLEYCWADDYRQLQFNFDYSAMDQLPF